MSTIHQRIGAATPGVRYFDEMQVNLTVNGLEAPSAEIPKRFALLQNYPNPFNPSTIILYQIPKESRVRLAVYNILGQIVRVLIDGNKAAGYYSYTFDASGLPSGVYFYRLESSGFHEVQKMLLLR